MAEAADTKLYLGIDATNAFPAEFWKYTGLQESERNPLALHVTLQYCGKEVSDKDVDTIVEIWRKTLSEAELVGDVDDVVTMKPEFALYGNEVKDNLVVLCSMTQKLADAVERARASVCKALPNVYTDDKPFSPHITVGRALSLPEIGKGKIPAWPSADDMPKFDFISITGWGSDSAVRTSFAVPLHTVKGMS